MKDAHALWVLILTAPLTVGQAPPLRAAPPGSADTVRELAEQITVRTDADAARNTRPYVEDRLSRIRRLVQGQVLEALRGGAGAKQAADAVRAVLRSVPEYDERARAVVYTYDLKGLHVAVVGYNIYYGSLGIPHVRVVIDGYRASGLEYQLAAEGGGALENYDLILDRLPSPRANEAWLLARGVAMGSSQYYEIPRIYSFDGYQFQALWESGPRYSPGYQIMDDTVRITYLGPDRGGLTGKQQDVLQDVIRLASGGPAVTTLQLRPGQQ
jgi:hypothetical protein